MKYESTRGAEKNLNFEDVLFAGYAKDHGLYMPETLPKICPEEFRDWRKLPYDNIVFEIFRKFISPEEMPNNDLKSVISSSFARFCHPSVIGIEKLPNDLTIFELFHGPTLAFKDLALSVVAGLLDYFMSRRKKHVIALVGTSGDTGSSALESIKGKKNIDIIVLFPKDRCTKIQQLQMTTVVDENIHLFCVDGTSDDLDVPIKQAFEDEDFAREYNLISLNSINMARILAQVPMYIYAYYNLAKCLGDPVEIIVPTGAAGSLTAGCFAQKMGYPIRLVPAVNINDVVARTFRDGIYSTSDTVHKTFSSAMDIQMPYNLERIFHIFSQGDCEKIKLWMQALEKEGRIKLPDDILTDIRKVIIDSHVVADEEVTRVIGIIRREFDYTVCPHTATGVSYYITVNRKTATSVPRGVFATASPEKFPEAVSSAGFEAPRDRVSHLASKEEKFHEMKDGENWLTILTNKIVAIKKSKQQKCS